ncbi:sec-independent protein translocase protein TatA [Luteococcus japonicus]|uniref:Sec-independent protein translocase protein TatA n=1 Tax=Luteococcus japonicus TaxID=33984 RepID=A0A3N1ZYG9_9ACTN|nr:sec-independent protein translocase protein TatA [Luteococcus japonicus]
MPNLGPTELLIILAIAILLFGGTRLAGVGKASGRAIREFKEETSTLKDDKAAKQVETQKVTETVDGTIVETEKKFEA